MTRARFRAAAAALAVLVIAGLAWWMSGGGRAPVPPAGSGAEVPARGTAAAAGPGEPGGAPPGGRGRDEGPAPGAEGGEEPAAVPEADPASGAVEGACVLEDGGPLEGIALRYVVTLPSGAIDVLSGESGAGGAFRLEKPARAVAIREVLAQAPGMRLASAEGGTLSEGGIVRPGTGPLRLVFREWGGSALVRLVDADAGIPLVLLKGLRVVWHLPDGTMTMGFNPDQAPGGWIPLPEGRLPESKADGHAGIQVDPSKVEVEFALPGYEKGRLPLTDVRGRVDLRVRPVPPDATGELAIPRVIQSIAIEETRVSATLRWTGPDPDPRTGEVLGLPSVAGPFSLYDLPDGPWVIEVAATLPDNTVVRGKRAFEKHGGTVDLGTIELKPAGRVSIRVVDSADAPIPQAWAVIVRPDENPDQGRRLDLNDRGEVSVGDLEPGVGHRAVVKGLPRDLEQTVVASADAKPVEFKWTEKLVPCRITLLVDGKAVANADGRTTIPAVVQDSPLPRDRGAWKSDGTFEAKLVPGTYTFSALATPKEGGELALFSGEVTVPSGDAFETRLELTRGNR